MQIWVIDNNVPIERCEDRRVKTGGLPLDREGLAHLVKLSEADWGGDAPLRDLCIELLKTDDGLLAFKYPPQASEHLEASPNRPDIVFYDWEYGAGIDALKELERLYSASFFLTQIFSSKNPEEIGRALDGNPELKRLRELILDSKEKGPGDLKATIQSAETFYSKNIGAIADPIRRCATLAVENTLRELGALPVHDALEVLGKKKETDSIDDLADVIAGAVVAALTDTAENSNGKSDGELRAAAAEAVAARTRAMIEEDADLVAHLNKLSRGAKKKITPEQREAVRKLLNFQMYHAPIDDYVRQGDIARIIQPTPLVTDELLLILNTSCHLEKCRPKTREVITCLKLNPLTAAVGFEHIGRGENTFGRMGKSVLRYLKPTKGGHGDAALGSIFFPSLRVTITATDKPLLDYVAVAQDLTSYRAAKITLKPGEERLTYKSISLAGDKKLERVCSVNFSLLPAVLATVTNTISDYGVRDLPEAETDRITGLK